MRSQCPINYWLELLGDKWSLLILRDLIFKNRHTFKEFMACEEAIASNILTDRLKRLEDMEIIARRQGNSHKDVRYDIAPKGIDLIPTLIEIIIWSHKHDAHTAAPDEFVFAAQANRKKFIQSIIKDIEESAP